MPKGIIRIYMYYPQRGWSPTGRCPQRVWGPGVVRAMPGPPPCQYMPISYVISNDFGVLAGPQNHHISKLAKTEYTYLDLFSKWPFQALLSVSAETAFDGFGGTCSDRLRALQDLKKGSKYDPFWSYFGPTFWPKHATVQGILGSKTDPKNGQKRGPRDPS